VLKTKQRLSPSGDSKYKIITNKKEARASLKQQVN
jgi:hypothetical protein